MNLEVSKKEKALDSAGDSEFNVIISLLEIEYFPENRTTSRLSEKKNQINSEIDDDKKGIWIGRHRNLNGTIRFFFKISLSIIRLLVRATLTY